jgi:exodeoxyribonuclease V gamma subunit
LQLARRLGAAPDASGSGDGGRGDGVSANISFSFPGVLRRRVLEAWSVGRSGLGESGEPVDPWSVERLVWSILEVADAAGSGVGGGDGALPRPLLDASPGTSRYLAARQVADLFDRYHVHRPAMVESWRMGADVDGVGGELPVHHRWQPALWREVRGHLGVPAPPERLGPLLERLQSGELLVELPQRICVFGMSSLPGGPGFIELAAALAATREVHLFLVEPSGLLMQRVSARPPSGANAPWYRLRADVDAAGLLHHPLLRSWGRVHCETASMLADARSAGAFSRVAIGQVGDDPAPGLLGRLRADVGADRVSTADLLPGELGAVDGRPATIEFHSCHGPARQVEVLHDTILRLLNDHPHLQEDDVLVVCPALESFAPLIEATFGRSARAGGRLIGGVGGPPALRYELADRSLGVAAPLVGAFRALIGLLGGRFDAPAVLDFLSLGPVRKRFDLDEDALALLAQWVSEVHIRFGLDAGSRAEWGIPVSVTANTWQAGVDRLLFGAAVRGAGSEPFLDTVGQVVPHGVEGSAVAVAGRLADALHRLGELARRVEGPRELEGWLDLLTGAVAELFELPREDAWQLDRLMRTLGDIADSAGCGGRLPSTPLVLDDVRQLLDERLHDPERGRPSFFRGGVTISSLTPLRWVPHKVIVMLGMDAAALAGTGTDGDDLTVLAPLVGDGDRRSELRQSLLETVLSAEEHLVVIRDGHDVRTNQEIPMAVPVAELRDAVLAMVHPDHRSAVAERIEVHHPRQAFAEAYFCDLPEVDGAGWSTVPAPPRSFDVSAASAAKARRRRTVHDGAFLHAPLVPVPVERIDLADLRRLLRNPIRYFLERRLELRLPRDDTLVEGTIPTKLEGLGRWALADRLLGMRAHHPDDPGVGDGLVEREAAIVAELEGPWRTAAIRTGAVPPGRLGADFLDDAASLVGAICRSAAREGVRLGPAPARRSVEVVASDGTSVAGQVELRVRDGAGEIGPALVSCSRRKGFHRLAVWLDLAVLTLTDPSTSWRGVVATRHASKSSEEEVSSYLLTGGDPADVARVVLDTVVDLHRRALCEPLPLFETASEALWRHPDALPVWPGRYPDRAEEVVYGRLSPAELCELPLHPLDPPGSAGDRARRYAEHLYGSLDDTLEAVHQ